MKRTLLIVLSLFTLTATAQKPQVKWGEEFKLRKGSTDLEIIHADNSAVYLQEGHFAAKTYFVVGATLRESATLVRLDKNLSEVYRSDFNQELKGKEFVEFFPFQEKLFLFASEYIKREKTLNIYGAEINKSNGQLSSDWTLLTSLQKDEKGDDINFKFAVNADSSGMMLVSSVEGKERNEYRIQEFDKALRSAGKAIYLSNEFDPKTFQLEDVLYTSNKKIFLVGRQYEYREGKKKKDKFLDFARYNIRMYNDQGKQQTEINTEVNGKWLTSTKLVQEKNKDIVLVAFYNNSRKSSTIDGMLVERIDPNSGQVISASEKQIGSSLLSGDGIVDKNETREERQERERLNKMKDEDEAFSKYMQFRNIFYTADNGLVILAEKYRHYMYTESVYSSSSQPKKYSVYECGNILMCKIDASGNISWLQVLPKDQTETITQYTSGLIVPAFFDRSNRPFYSGFGAMQARDNINIIFNDNSRNADVTQVTQKARSIAVYRKSTCYVVTVDATTGKCTRRELFSNADVPTSMPRLGSVLGQNMYIVGKDDPMIGKTKLAVGIISIN